MTTLVFLRRRNEILKESDVAPMVAAIRHVTAEVLGIFPSDVQVRVESIDTGAGFNVAPLDFDITTHSAKRSAIDRVERQIEARIRSAMLLRGNKVSIDGLILGTKGEAASGGTKLISDEILEKCRSETGHQLVRVWAA